LPRMTPTAFWTCRNWFKPPVVMGLYRIPAASASVMEISADGVVCAVLCCKDVAGVLRNPSGWGDILVTMLFRTDEAALIELGQAVASFDSIEAVS